MQPLVNNQKIHVPKHSEQKCQLRQDLNKNMHFFVVVPIIEALHYYS